MHSHSYRQQCCPLVKLLHVVDIFLAQDLLPDSGKIMVVCRKVSVNVCLALLWVAWELKILRYKSVFNIFRSQGTLKINYKKICTEKRRQKKLWHKYLLYVVPGAHGELWPNQAIRRIPSLPDTLYLVNLYPAAREIHHARNV